MWNLTRQKVLHCICLHQQTNKWSANASEISSPWWCNFQVYHYLCWSVTFSYIKSCRDQFSARLHLLVLLPGAHEHHKQRLLFDTFVILAHTQRSRQKAWTAQLVNNYHFILVRHSHRRYMALCYMFSQENEELHYTSIFQVCLKSHKVKTKGKFVYLDGHIADVGILWALHEDKRRVSSILYHHLVCNFTRSWRGRSRETSTHACIQM